MNIDDEDKALFRQAVSGIRKIRHDSRQHRSVNKRPTHPAPHGRLNQSVTQEEILTIGDVIHYLRPGGDPRLLKKLQQGKIPPQATLDLHGYTRSQARPMLEAFLHDCRMDGLRSLLIVHGKGWRSEGFKPVLKTALNQWLPRFPEVLAFCSAKSSHGGNGALYLLLDRPHRGLPEP